MVKKQQQQNVMELYLSTFERTNESQKMSLAYEPQMDALTELVESALLATYPEGRVSWPGIFPMVSFDAPHPVDIVIDQFNCDKHITLSAIELEINLLRAEGEAVILPDIKAGFFLTQYDEIKKIMLNAGAAYKRCTFVFPEGSDASQILADLQAGSRPNKRKELQQFFTPEAVAARVRKLADIGEGDTVLEPSAGRGALIAGLKVDVCEIDDANLAVLERDGHRIVGRDFIEAAPDLHGRYDRIIANPPFTKGQDVDHVMAMWYCLKPGGRLVSVMGTGWRNNSDKRSVSFKEFVDDQGGYVEDVDAGAFKSSGTGIATVIVVLEK